MFSRLFNMMGRGILRKETGEQMGDVVIAALFYVFKLPMLAGLYLVIIYIDKRKNRRNDAQEKMKSHM
jgi:hypothetical protein